MENFDLKKFLTENKITTNSRMVSENTQVTEYGQAPDSLIGLVEEYLTNSGLDGNQLLLELDELWNYCNEKIAEIQQELEG